MKLPTPERSLATPRADERCRAETSRAEGVDARHREEGRGVARPASETVYCDPQIDRSLDSFFTEPSGITQKGRTRAEGAKGKHHRRRRWCVRGARSAPRCPCYF